ncbi:MAG TPA: DUF5947 family protein, partial [Kofleriaceae bacterium]|nr:DUF5947 family protein [Kofleriaceae bacterium]
RYRTVPDRVRADSSFAMTREAWTALGVPVELAFCVRDSATDAAVISYPGPAGIVDAALEPEAWAAIAAATPLAAELEPDVEALLVHAPRGGAPACWLVPITRTFELVARLRATWQGFTGGDDARRALAAFVDELRGPCTGAAREAAR